MKANKPKPTSKSRRWYNHHYWALLLAGVSFVAAYAIGTRSIDTGSWQQYGMTIFFVFFGVNRLFRAAHTAATSWIAKRRG
jgi:hypothetical protein